MLSFAATRRAATENRRASIPSSDVTHMLPAAGGGVSRVAVAGEDGDSDPQPARSIVSNTNGAAGDADRRRLAWENSGDMALFPPGQAGAQAAKHLSLLSAFAP